MLFHNCASQIVRGAVEPPQTTTDAMLLRGRHRLQPTTRSASRIPTSLASRAQKAASASALLALMMFQMALLLFAAAAALLSFGGMGLHALQHRGQESAGIVSFDGKNFNNQLNLGLVGDYFTKQNVIKRLPGYAALGHVRYSTTGKTLFKNIQPLFADLLGGGLACSHNGNLTNGIELRKSV